MLSYNTVFPSSDTVVEGVLQRNCSKKFCKIYRTTLAIKSFLPKSTPLQVVSCKICEIFQDIYVIGRM